MHGRIIVINILRAHVANASKLITTATIFEMSPLRDTVKVPTILHNNNYYIIICYALRMQANDIRYFGTFFSLARVNVKISKLAHAMHMCKHTSIDDISQYVYFAFLWYRGISRHVDTELTLDGQSIDDATDDGMGYARLMAKTIVHLI